VTLFEPPEPPLPAPPTVRVRLDVAYDGRDFHGFAPQPGVKTVGGALAKSLERVLRFPVVLTCAGRTDAGVHARGQVVTFDVSAEDLDLAAVQRAVNKMCGPAIVVTTAATVDDGFDARFSARSRRYRYTVLNRPVADPFLAATAWHVEAPLDLAAMRLACDPLIGAHDFTSFCRRPKFDTEEAPSLVRQVLDARWEAEPDGILQFCIESTSFCHQMVRSIVGLMVDIGTGRKHAGDVTGILRAQDRAAAGPVAPAHGLCLWEVRY
jgi:tRNA pseudouridine38-40 synthase